MADKQWEEVRKQVEAEVEKTRKQAAVADSFNEMEDLVKEMGQQIESIVLAGVAQQREVEGGQRCPECDAPMKRKDKVTRQVKTTAGDVKLKRGRWVCAECGTTIFPPG